MPYFDPASGGFYSDGRTDIPEGAIEVSEQRREELLLAGLPIIANASNELEVVYPAPPTTEQLAARAISERTRLLQIATLEIAPLQDAVDVGIASETEQTKLTAWKVYRVHLSRIEQQLQYPHTIEWPESPAH